MTMLNIRAYTGHVGPSELGKSWQTDPAVMGGGTLMDNGIGMSEEEVIRSFSRAVYAPRIAIIVLNPRSPPRGYRNIP